MTAKYSLYLGEAGQSAAASYFLARGWNVATPRVDIGDDLLVIEDSEGYFFRIQVKTSQAVSRTNGLSVRFNISLRQLQNEYNPELYYFFIAYYENEWQHKILIPRDALLSFHQNNKIGSPIGDNLVLYFSFQPQKVTCYKVDFTRFYNNFEDFPIIVH
jgi:PD-(D/E)XK endonuclease